jgi:nucleoside phosphorylase
MLERDEEDDARAIIEHLENVSKFWKDLEPRERKAVWNFLWSDLLTKTANLNIDIRRALVVSGLLTRLPVEIKVSQAADVIRGGSGEMRSRAKADVMIFTIKEEELNAALVAFGIDKRKVQPLDAPFGHLVYRTEIINSAGKALELFFTIVGEARNVNCANFCRDVFECYEVGLAVLLGIAGGNRDKVKYSDVVGATEIIDIEGGRVEATRTLPEPKFYSIEGSVKDDFFAFNPVRYGFRDLIQGRLELLKSTGVVVPRSFKYEKINYHMGVICAGDKLRRDGMLPGLADNVHRHIMAVEMEGSGFASSCKSKKREWLVLRGISDFADSKKRDHWQGVAAYCAACVLDSFLRNAYRKRDITF